MDIEKTKNYIHNLYDSLMEHSDKNSALLDITDVLSQVYLKLDTAKNPEALVNRMVNYIYIVGFSNINLSKDENDNLNELGDSAKRAGWNGVYRGNSVDKSQFYSIFEKMPVR